MEFKKPKIVKTLEKEEQNGKTYLRSITNLHSSSIKSVQGQID